MKESICILSAALQNPDQAGLQHISFDKTVARKTLCRAMVGMPWVLSTRIAYSDLEPVCQLSRESPLSAVARLLCGNPGGGGTDMGTSDGRGPPYCYCMASLQLD